MYDLGAAEYLRLPVHDELILSVPEARTDGAKKIVSEAMAQTMNGVLIDTDAETLGRSWGGGYVPEDERDTYEGTFTRH